MKLVIVLVVQEEDYDKDKESFGDYLKRIRKKYEEINKTKRVIIIA